MTQGEFSWSQGQVLQRHVTLRLLTTGLSQELSQGTVPNMQTLGLITWVVRTVIVSKEKKGPFLSYFE